MASPFPRLPLRGFSCARQGTSQSSNLNQRISARRTALAIFLVIAPFLARVSAQEAPTAAPKPHAHAEHDASPPQDTSMAGMNMPMDEPKAFQLPSPHEGSGTAWQPASVQGPAWMWIGRKNNKLAPAAREWRVRKLAELSATSLRSLFFLKKCVCLLDRATAAPRTLI